jgi:hypothetical protein
MFLELMTLWERAEKPSDGKAPARDSPVETIAMKLLGWKHQKNFRSLPPWKRRQIGVLFSKKTSWIFLVFIEPVLTDVDDKNELKFCCRRIIRKHDLGGKKANAVGGDGKPILFEPSKHQEDNAVQFIANGLKGGPPTNSVDKKYSFVQQIVVDVLSGWEDFVTYVLSEIITASLLFLLS